jgi:hypothetical protein
MSAQQISFDIGGIPQNSWTIGDQRQTPKGTILDGKYDETYWTTGLTSARPLSELPEAIDEFVAKLQSKASFLRRFIETGGTTELFVVVLGPGGFSLSKTTVAQLAALDIEFGLYVAPSG